MACFLGAAAVASSGLGLAGCGAPPPEGADTVVVVHGLGRTSASMAILSGRMRDEGYRVVSFGYPSKSEPLEDLVARLDAELAVCCSDGGDVHFVTHSMGGVLVHMYLAEASDRRRGRVVMLAPPSQGSEIVDAFSDSPLLRGWLGPAGVELGTDSASAPNRLGAADFPLGIIAGDRSLNPLSSWLIPGPDDGKVSVERARAEGAADFLVLPATHTFIMNRTDVAEQVVHFLRTGRFHREGPESRPTPDTTGVASRDLLEDPIAGYLADLSREEAHLDRTRRAAGLRDELGGDSGTVERTAACTA